MFHLRDPGRRKLMRIAEFNKIAILSFHIIMAILANDKVRAFHWQIGLQVVSELSKL